MTSYKELTRRVSFRPYSYLSPSIAGTSLGLLVLLVPQVVMLALTHSFSSLLIVSLTVLAALLADILNSFLMPHFERSWCIALVQGMVIGLLLPSTYPPAAAFFITLCTLLLAKYAFGGFSGPWVNPAAVTVAVAFFLNVPAFPLFFAGPGVLSGRNAALTLIQDGTIPLVRSDASVTAFLNKTVFSLFKLAVPEGYVSLFWDTGALIPAFRFNLITLISSLVLISLDMVDWVVPACFIAVYSLLVRLCGPLVTGGAPLQGDILLALLTGGTLFSTLYVLPWFGTTPASAAGKCVYGVVAGILAFLIMGMGTSSVGYVFVVLSMNVVSPVIQLAEESVARRRVRTILMPRIESMKEADRG